MRLTACTFIRSTQSVRARQVLVGVVMLSSVYLLTEGARILTMTYKLDPRKPRVWFQLQGTLLP